MADFIRNTLTITCKNNEIKNKIKKMIFRTNDKNEQEFSMTKLLPVPEGISENPGYSEYGYDWCCTVWGTKWDARYGRIFESGDTIIIYYDTAWDPNIPWVDTLCRYIRCASYDYKKFERGEISVTHFYCEEYVETGTEMKWTLGKGVSLTENIVDPDCINYPNLILESQKQITQIQADSKNNLI